MARRRKGGGRAAVRDYESTSSSSMADGSMASLVEMAFGHCSLISCLPGLVERASSWRFDETLEETSV